ncbi:MAG: GNAT family N-acetyltransferase [Gammaproteobacteria bacterium]|nr:MAG: GNAT family N-acetyltransferase [Gammaproteobacteria bacterium]
MKIDIRHAEPGDYEALREIHSQPKVVRGTMMLPFPSVESWKKRLAEKPTSLYCLVACVDDELVGTLSLKHETHPRRRHAGYVGMSVHDLWQGRGIGSALMEAVIELADNWLSLSRLELNVYTDNDAAIHLYEKHGFEIEGTLRDYAFRDGGFVDSYAMARIRTPSGAD